MAESNPGRMNFDHVVESSEPPHQVVGTPGTTAVNYWFNELDVPQEVVDATHITQDQKTADRAHRSADDYPIE